MARSCGRPGCSEPGAVAYGLAPRLLLAWLAPLGPEADPATPVLCRRHADRTSVPDGWTLDDRREPAPRLFRPPPEVETDRPTERLAPVVPIRARADVEAPELPLDVPLTDLGPEADEAVDQEPGEGGTGEQETASDPGPTPPTPADELGELLVANSPLLARAFHGRPRT